LIVESLLGESYATELRKIPHEDNNVGRRISDISEDLYDQEPIDQTKTSRFALQIDEASDVLKDAHLITYVRYMMENDMRENFLF
jgi:hypothetical protein